LKIIQLGLQLSSKIIFCFWGEFFNKKSRFCFENNSIGATKKLLEKSRSFYFEVK
jgi:hypothetical protein